MPTTCGDCGEVILGDEGSGDVSARTPCPKCGSHKRNCSVQAQPGHFLVLGGTATLTVTRYSTILLQQAQRFIDGGDYGAAVVFAHVGCEVAAERALGGAFSARGIADLEEPVEAFMNGYSLANRRNRDLYNALAGVSLQTQPFWSQFCASATRRNAIIHGGMKIEKKSDAEDSLKACTELVAYLNQE